MVIILVILLVLVPVPIPVPVAPLLLLLAVAAVVMVVCPYLAYTRPGLAPPSFSQVWCGSERNARPHDPWARGSAGSRSDCWDFQAHG